MFGLTCEKDCPDMSWKFVEPQLMISGGMWGAMLVFGYILTCYSFTVDLDKFKERCQIFMNRCHTSRTYVWLLIALTLFQCGMFAVRTFGKAVNGMSFVIEVLLCMCYLTHMTLNWLVNSITGFSEHTVFMFSWALVDCVLVPSVVCLTVIQIDGKRGWFSFSFLSALHLLELWRWLLEIYNVSLQVLFWQAVDVSANVLVMIYFAAMMMMSLENLGDPDWLSDLNEDKWTALSSLYYVFVTISTVGYGDLAPLTALGRVFAIIVIFGGLASALIFGFSLLKVLAMFQSGSGHYTPRMTARHVVITGNPTIQMVKDFMKELFHPDHADDAEDLHLVFLLPRGSNTMALIMREMRKRHNIHIAPRIHCYMGSVLERQDLMRIAPMQATAFFVLPNIQCRDYMHEDTEDIIRMMSILRINPQVRVILLLLKAENEQLLHETGVGKASHNITCLSMDQFKLELVGKSCSVPGFATLICNLFKSIQDAADDDTREPWLVDFDKGTGMEIYEVELSNTYAARSAVFSEVVVDVLEQTEGAVYLIGLVETSLGLNTKRVIVNPGTWYPIKDPRSGVVTNGVFIAADRESVHQCEGGVFLGRRSDMNQKPDANQSEAVVKPKKPGTTNGQPAVQEKQPQQSDEADAIAQFAQMDPLEDLIRRDPALTASMQESARNLIKLAKQQHRAREPERIPLKKLAQGGHILFLCIGCRPGDELRLGAEHFLRPIRGASNSTIGVDTPLLIFGPCPPRDWHRVSGDRSVFFMRGSPLSLFDLERANFRKATDIFICHCGTPRTELTEQWMVDSDIVCCTRLLESELPPHCKLSIISEIAVDTNHPFIPLPNQGPLTHEATKKEEKKTKRSWFSRRGKKSLAEIAEEESEIAEKCECGHHYEDETVLHCPMCGKVRPGKEFEAGHMAGGYGSLKTDQKKHKQHRNKAIPTHGDHKITEYYRQPRYACGQLFVGNVITSLTVNSFYNPSLWELVHQMIKANIEMVPLPRDWEGKSYFLYFDKLLREDDLMAVAIYRKADSAGGGDPRGSKGKPGRSWNFVFTAPPAKETHMMRGDRVICFTSAFKTTKADDESDDEGPAGEAGEDGKAKAKPRAKRKPGGMAALAKKRGGAGPGGNNMGMMMRM